MAFLSLNLPPPFKLTTALSSPSAQPIHSLLKLSQALLKTQDKPKSLWLVTNGVYVGEIKPAQGAIQGFSTVLKSELNGVVRAWLLTYNH